MIHFYAWLTCLFLLNIVPFSFSQSVNYTHPIPFQPTEYVCYFNQENLIIDGKINESAWQKTPWTSDFVDIRGRLKPMPHLQTRVKVLWNKEYLFVAAELSEPHIWATLMQHDTIIYLNDNFEIFLDPGGDGINYYEWEINANNTIWDLLLLYPYRIPNRQKMLNNWETLGIKHVVSIQGTKNNPTDVDTSWTVEFALPWKALSEFAPQRRIPKNGDQWRANFMRVDWILDIIDGKYQKRPLPETNIISNSPDYIWTWSPVGEVNIHRPETWGYLQFSEIPIGTAIVNFNKKPDETIKWALWQLHLQQLKYYRKHNRYIIDLQDFTLPKVKLNNYQIDFQLDSNGYRYEISANSFDNKKRIRITEDGRLQIY